MKICVYAIAKNEIEFLSRWYESVKEADYVCVLDTGSTDGTYEQLKTLNIICDQIKYDKFRFDSARNASLKLIPDDADICVCVDIDEVFVKGWSKILKNKWNKNTTQARYRYTWNFNPDGSEGYVFMSEKIHKNKHFLWKNPVHEILYPAFNFTNNIIDIPEIQLNHRADNTKSRSSYLPLLELSVKENPNDDRNTHYLAREYYFHGQFDKAIKYFKKHLALETSIWNAERSASYRYMAKCYYQKNNYRKQEECLLNAILEDNTSREAYFELGEFYYNNKKYLKCCLTLEEMLKIKNRKLNYITMSECWSDLPYDYLSIAYFNLKNYKKSLSNINFALLLNPKNERLKQNKTIIESALKNNP